MAHVFQPNLFTSLVPPFPFSHDSFVIILILGGFVVILILGDCCPPFPVPMLEHVRI